MDMIWQQHSHQIPLLLGLLFLSACFSGAETAFFSLQNPELNRFRKQNSLAGNALLTLHGDLPGFLMTVLLSNMVVNILFFASVTVIGRSIGQRLGNGAELAFGAANLIAVIIFGEITPKTLAAGISRPFAQAVAVPLYALHRVLGPVRWALGGVLLVGERALNLHALEKSAEEELDLLLRASQSDGVISRHEHELLSGVLDLPQVKVLEIMTPRIDAVSVPADTTIADALRVARKHGHAKLPVRNPETEEFTGWIDVRHIFSFPDAGPIAPHVRKALVVSEFDRGNQVLQTFLDKDVRIAVVVDERGGTTGLLTLSDLLAEIVGDIGDEDDIPKQEIISLGSGACLVSGGISLREWCTMFSVPAATLPHVATLSGLITAQLGRTAAMGDVVNVGPLRLEIRAMRRRRVHTVHQSQEEVA